MSFLDSYDKDERPIVKRALLDLALRRLSMVQTELRRVSEKFGHRYDIEREAVRIYRTLRDAEDFLNEVLERGPASLFPWDVVDFHDFWQHGGDVSTLESMTEYIGRMPDWYRLIVEAENMPDDYGQVLLDSIPTWRG